MDRPIVSPESPAPERPERGISSATPVESLSPEEVRRRMGVDFEAENHRRELARWRKASPADHGRILTELMRYGEAMVKVTGIEKRPSRPLSEIISSRRTSLGS